MSQNNKQSPVGLFLSFFLKAIVIILGLVILAMSAYLIKTIISNKNAEKEKKKEVIGEIYYMLLKILLVFGI